MYLIAARQKIYQTQPCSPDNDKFQKDTRRTAQRYVRFGLSLGWPHTLGQNVAQLGHRILILSPVVTHVHLLLEFLLGLAFTWLK